MVNPVPSCSAPGTFCASPTVRLRLGRAGRPSCPPSSPALDGRVRDALCAWPAVVRAVLARADARRHPPTDGIDDRLLSLFGALGNRWGRRTPDGIAIALPLTHDMVAMLVGAHRPTVTSALDRLSCAGRLRRDGERGWLLAAVQSPPLEAIAA